MSRYIIKLRAAAAILLLGFALPLFAQEAPMPGKADPEKVKEFKERLLLKVEEVKHQKIREILVLDDESAKKFFAQYDPAEKDMIALIQQRQEQEIKLLKLTQGDYKDADVDPTIQNIKALNEKIKDRYEQLDNSLKPILTPRQRAKFLVFNNEFNKKVREKLQQKREQWKDNHPGKHPFRNKGGNKSSHPKQ